MMAVGRSIAHRSKKWEDMLSNHLKHFSGGKVLEVRPAKILVAASLGIVAFWEYSLFYWFLKKTGFVFFKGLGVIKSAYEKEVSDLFFNFHRV